MNFRILYSNNGVITDYSKELNNYHSGTATIAFNHAEDFIYIGSPFAFNGAYLKLSSASALHPAIAIQYWDSNSWRDGLDVIDETNNLAVSGHFKFQIDREYGSWAMANTQKVNGSSEVTGLGTVNIYDKYWARIKTSLSDTISLDWIGHCFINDNDLKVEYPSFGNSSLMGAIKSGKISWEEQIVRASQIVIEDLTQRRVITNQGQIVDVSKLQSMTVSKTAELIYTMLGDDYIDQRREANSEYSRRVKQNVLNIDMNGDGDLSVSERKCRQGFLYR